MKNGLTLKNVKTKWKIRCSCVFFLASSLCVFHYFIFMGIILFFFSSTSSLPNQRRWRVEYFKFFAPFGASFCVFLSTFLSVSLSFSHSREVPSFSLPLFPRESYGDGGESKAGEQSALRVFWIPDFVDKNPSFFYLPATVLLRSPRFIASDFWMIPLRFSG